MPLRFSFTSATACQYIGFDRKFSENIAPVFQSWITNNMLKYSIRNT